VWAGTGTVTGTPEPPVETVVTVPVTARGEGLVMTIVAAASSPLSVDPAQNQADDSALAGVTLTSDADDDVDADAAAPLPADGPVRPRVAPSATPMPTRRATTPKMSTARRMASLTWAPIH
jgi:hypothetical protein